MRVVGLPGVLCRFSKLGYAQLSEDARERSRYVSCFRSLREQGLSSNRAGQVIGISRATLYRWEKRREEEGLKGLADRSRRPRGTRKPTWGAGSLVSQGAVPSLGQGQTGATVAARRLAGINIHGRPYPDSPQRQRHP